MVDKSGFGILVSTLLRIWTDRFGSWSINSRPSRYASAIDMTKVLFAAGTRVSSVFHTLRRAKKKKRPTMRENHSLPRTREELLESLLNSLDEGMILTRETPQLLRPFLRNSLFRLNPQRICQPCIPLSDDTFRITFQRDHLSRSRIRSRCPTTRTRLKVSTSTRLNDERLTRVRLVTFSRSMTCSGTSMLADLLALPANLGTRFTLARSMTTLLASMVTASEEFATRLTARDSVLRASNVLYQRIFPACTRFGG